MRDPFPVAIAPFAAILLLPRMDMFIMQMLYQQIHIPQVSSFTAIPLARADLLPMPVPAVVILVATACCAEMR